MTRISIQSGELDIEINDQGKLHELLSFASRENPKRGFLFVSKVLGKHIPCRPSVMRQTYDQLASQIGTSPDVTFVVGMAETATGLGAGVADSLARMSRGEVYYQHTTRQHLDATLWVQMDEVHSHAPDHLLYEPPAGLRPDIVSAGRLVLVDDEITTGRTLLRLSEQLLEHLPEVREVIVVSLVSWLSEEAKGPYQSLGPEVRFTEMLAGHFSFTQAPDFNPSLPARVAAGINTLPCRMNLGRRAIKMPLMTQVYESLNKQDMARPHRVIGTGEHLYLPFLYAEWLEQRGLDVWFQSTTRSPILLGDAINHKVIFSSRSTGTEMYLHNCQPDPAERIHLMFETADMRTDVDLQEKIDALLAPSQAAS